MKTIEEISTLCTVWHVPAGTFWDEAMGGDMAPLPEADVLRILHDLGGKDPAADTAQQAAASLATAEETMARYEIRIISSSECEGIDATDELRDEHQGQRWHEDFDDAKAAARELSQEYHYGTVVVDHRERTIDWGSDITDFSGDEVPE